MTKSDAAQQAANPAFHEATATGPDSFGPSGRSQSRQGKRCVGWIAVATGLLSACAGMGGEGESRGAQYQHAGHVRRWDHRRRCRRRGGTDHGLGLDDAGTVRRRRRPAGRGLRRRQQEGLGRLRGQLPEPRRRLRLPRTRRALRIDRELRRRSPRRRRGLRRCQYALGRRLQRRVRAGARRDLPDSRRALRRRALRRRHHRRRRAVR